MNGIHLPIKVIKAPYRFFRDIFYYTTHCYFQSFITFQPVTQDERVFRNVSAEDFLQLLRSRFGTVYCSRYYAAFTLRTGTIQTYSLEIPLFSTFAPCLRGLRRTESESAVPL